MKICKHPLITLLPSQLNAVLFMGQGIKEWAKKNLWETALKKFEGIWSA